MSQQLETHNLYRTWEGRVKQEWCDYNGHLNLAYYIVIFDFATDAFYDSMGLGETYKIETNNSWFTAESHVCYLSELFAENQVYCNSQLIKFNRKKMHYFHQMHKVNDDQLVATSELLALHVNLNERKVQEVPEEKIVNLRHLYNKHRSIPMPPQLGRKISL